MSESLTVSYGASLNALLSQAIGGGVASFPLNLPSWLQGNLGSGTGKDNANQFFTIQKTLAASGTQSLNLNTMSGAVDALGNGFSIVDLKYLAILMLGNLNCQYVGTVAVHAGGTGYAVNDVLTVAGGTGTAATLKVLTVSSGVITSVQVLTPGSYTVNPSTSANAVTGGTGTTATMDLTMATVTTQQSAVYVEGDFLTIGALGTTAQWTSFLTPNTASILLKSGTNANPGYLQHSEGGATGVVVGASSTNNTLLITNSGSNPVTYQIIAVGATA
jgi:hypothetical protein